MIRQAISFIKEGKHIEGRQILLDLLMKECVGLIISQQQVREEEAISIFYEALELLCEQIQNELFIYKDDKGFKTYLKTTCLNKTREYKRILKGSAFISASETLEETAKDYEELVDTLQREVYNRKKALYGIQLDKNDGTHTYKKPSIDMIKAFHHLKDKCKLLIVLRVLFNIDHKEIVNTLSLFYKMKNENVSKSMLRRCKEEWKGLIVG